MENDKEVLKAEKPPEKKEMRATVLHNGSNEKVLTISTDGSNINLDPQNLSRLEIEMILVKSLQFMRGEVNAKS